ncbi:MAG: hypothetical protein NW241_15525 [Bacteroidia bacterium]|nr:hypothetical protein [Bacteroidia bacterium]
MENLPDLRRQHRWELLLKELDHIRDSIKNLDDLIYKTKNFGFLFWGGSIALIVEHLKGADDTLRPVLLGLTAVIPVLFWVMDYHWRKYLLQTSEREKVISRFLNSEAFEELVLMGVRGETGKQFPFYDVVGWIYTVPVKRKEQRTPQETPPPPSDQSPTSAGETTKQNASHPFAQDYLIDPKKFQGWKVIWYKDAKWFYPSMILVSVVLCVFALLA